MNEQPSEAPEKSWATRLGELLQGLLIGGLLTFAVLNLMRVASEVQIFRYQGF